MDVLHRMQNVWPSAYRAHQLLQGAKVPLVDVRASLSPPVPERSQTKRPAELSLELEYPEDSCGSQHSPQPVMLDRRVSVESLRPHSSGSEHMYRAQPKVQHPPPIQTHSSPQSQPRHSQPQLSPHQAHSPQHASPHAQTYPSRPTSGNQAHAQSNFSLGIDLPATAPFFQQFNDRWTGEGPINNYPNTLSTSVLPQEYSTGLIDDRAQRGHQRQPQRFPQYWSDYSTLGQMEATYGVPMVGTEIVTPPPHQASRSSPHSQQASYSQDQYTVFSTYIASFCIVCTR